MIGGVKTKIKIIDYALLFALLACLCLMMSMTGISAADSDDILDNQSAIDQIPLEDNQDGLCGIGSVNHEMHTSSSFDQSDDSSNLHFNKDETHNLKFGQSDDSSNLDFGRSYVASNLNFGKSHDEINTTLNQSTDNNLLTNKAENDINSSNLADSRPQIVNQTTLHDCGYEHRNTNFSDANHDDGKKTVEYKFSGDFIDYSYNLYTVNQINLSNYAQIHNTLYSICITRDWDGSEKFYRKDSNITLNFNHIFEGMNPDDDNAPQLSDDSIQERGLSFDELIIEDNNCIPSDYQFLDQLIKLDYENNISTIYRLGNTHTGYNSTYTDLDYETLLPIILSFNLKSGFTFNYMDSWHPNINIININKNCVKISGVYAEGNKLTIINNSLKCIYAAPKFISKESEIVVENTCKYLIFNNTLTLNNNMQDYQSKCLKTITSTGILILNNYCNNIKKCIFESSHSESTSVISNSFSVSNFVFNKTITSVEIMEILSIFTHAKSCDGQRDGTLAIIDLEQINCNDCSIMSNGGK